MRSPVADLLADLDAALTAVHVEWFLFGAQAAILYGVARLTADVDVTARVPGRLSNLAVIEAMGHRGFRTRFDDPTLVEQHRVLPFVYETDAPTARVGARAERSAPGTRVGACAGDVILGNARG